MTTRQVMLGLYSDVEEAATAVAQLQDKPHTLDITPEDLAVLSHTDVDDVRDVLDMDLQSTTTRGAAVGATLGTIIGALGGLAIVPVIGFGSLLATGLLGAASGTFAGGYYGAIYGSRLVSQEEYDIKETLADGGILVIVDVDQDETKQEQVKRILSDNDPVWVMIDEADEDALLADLANVTPTPAAS